MVWGRGRARSEREFGGDGIRLYGSMSDITRNVENGPKGLLCFFF